MDQVIPHDGVRQNRCNECSSSLRSKKPISYSLFSNIDAELILHAMIEFPNYNRALIVTGDGDFYCLVKYLKEKDKLLKLMIPNQKNFSSLLREFIVDIVFMNNLKEKLELK